LSAVKSSGNRDQELRTASAQKTADFIDAVQRKMREGLIDNEEAVALGFRHRHQKDQAGDHLLPSAVGGVADFGWRFAVESDSRAKMPASSIDLSSFSSFGNSISSFALAISARA
jgi:hypothetical protein